MVGGMTVNELNDLEIYFITIINWTLYISTEDYDRYLVGFKAYTSTLLP
jgi:hypothetical protein